MSDRDGTLQEEEVNKAMFEAMLLLKCCTKKILKRADVRRGGGSVQKEKSKGEK